MNTTSRFRRFSLASLFAAAVLTLSGAAPAAETDLATGPLITPGASTVRPNLFFILDNSGSMNWDYLPDWVVDSNWCKGSTGTASLKCCRTSSGGTITSSSTSSTCLPQNSSTGANLDGNGQSNLRGMPPFHAADFNSAYYNPAVTYAPPVDSSGNAMTSYSGTGSVPWDAYNIQYTAAQTLALTSNFPDVEWCNGASTTDCLRNDNYLLPGTVGGISYTTMRATTASGSKTFATGSPNAPTTATRSVGPYYYAMVPGEYCTTPKLTDCIYATGQTSSGGKNYLYPATLRWCNNSAGRVAGETGAAAGNACQAVKNATYQYARYPTLKLADGVTGAIAWGRVTVNAAPDNTAITLANFIINNTQSSQVDLFAGTPLSWSINNNNSDARRNNLATAVVNKINANTTTTGFSAVLDNSSNVGRLRVNGPLGATYNGASVTVDGDLLGGGATAVTAGTTMSRTTNFANGATAVDALYAPGSFKRIDIVGAGTSFANLCISNTGVLSETTSATCSGTMVIDRSNRTDCTGRPTCTYEQELSNFANWFAWYRSRMQLAKSSLSLSFQSVDERYRVGYFTINNASSNLVNIQPFNAAHKESWYAKLFAANPDGGTSLRQALANAGRIYAGKTAITGAIDPVQYSCQKNYTILSTDGYWNGSNGVQINGSTAIGNEDSTGMVIGDVTGPFADTYSGTLADVAAYYYKTDLRDPGLLNCTGALGTAVCTNDVPTTNENKNAAQHMMTSTIGLGIDGVMKYRDDYITPTSEITDDYSAVRDATTANPTQGICPWQGSGNCNWPNPQTSSSSEIQERIDDLWHAAVNGHGRYYSARDAFALSRGISDALSRINRLEGGGAAATTSNPNVTTGDNFAFSSKYWTVDWTGELYRETMDLTSGNIVATANDWKAHELLDSASWSGRGIYTFAAGGGAPRSFAWNSLTGGGCNPPANEQGCFISTYIDTGLAQFCASGPLCLSAADKASAAGQNLVDYLRGDKSHEDTTSTTGFYRERKHRLGDIVNSEAVYVGKYLFDYGTSNGYPAQNTLRSDPSVYVAANDGMVHAFNAGDVNAGGGTERWAYVPSMAVRNLHRLADKEYGSKHRYFVDGSPVASDVKDSTWKTILVGGLAGGGPGYYALDITDQSAPKVLWEFRQKTGCTATTPAGAARYGSSGIARMIEDCDLGYSFGNPVISKLPNGTWVVMVTSGYNNHGNGDGKGYLYILNAMSGAVIHKLSTGVGDTVTPSGLGRINAWVDDAMKDNTAKYVYGGDLLGNMWKFDLTGGSPTRSLLINIGASKPITAKPELGEVVKANGQKKRVVFFPTGRLLGNDDLDDVNTQSFYGVWDADSGSPSTLVPSAANSGGTGRIGTVQPSVFEDDTNHGWQLDFPEAGERGNTDPILAFGTLLFSTNKPSTPDPCNPSGFSSWVYNIDYLSGGVVQVAGSNNSHLATAYAGASTRPNVVVLPSGVVKSITRTSGQEVVNNVEEVRIKSGGTSARRVTWRELLN